MPGEVELSRLVVRLIGDAAPLIKAFDESRSILSKVGTTVASVTADVTAAMPKVATAVDTAARKMKELAEHTKSFGETLLQPLKAIGMGVDIKGAFDKWEEYERAGMRLNAAIEANGQVAEIVGAQYEAFAGQISKTTLTSKIATLDLLQMATSYGLVGDAAERAVKNAIGLAATKPGGGNAANYLRQTIALEQGHSEMLRRMFPQLRDVENETERTAMANKLLANGFKLAEAEAQSLSGRLELVQRKFKGMLASMTRDVGESAVPALTAFIEWAERAVTAITSLPSWVKTSAVAFVVLAGGVVALLKGSLLLAAAFTASKVAVLAWVKALMANPLALTIVGVVGVIAAMAVYSKLLDGIAEKLPIVGEGLAAQNAALAENAKLQSELVGIAEKRATDITGKLETFDTRAEKKTYLEAELEKARGQIESYTKYKEAAQAKLDDEGLLDKAGSKLTGFLGFGDPMANERAELEQYSKLLGVAQKLASSLKTELDKLSDTKQQKALNKEIDETEKKLERELATIGMTADQLRIYDLMQEKMGKGHERPGAVPDQLIHLEGLAILVAEAREAQKLSDEIDKLNKHLQEQVETFGMTTHEAELYKLAIRGATDAQLRFARETGEMLEVLEHVQHIMEKGEQLTNQVAPPLEKFKDRIEELKEMLDLGAISTDTYNRAVHDAEEELVRAAKQADAASHKFDAAAFGSAEALGRIADWKDKLQGQKPITAEDLMKIDREKMAKQLVGEDLKALSKTSPPRLPEPVIPPVKPPEMPAIPPVEIPWNVSPWDAAMDALKVPPVEVPWGASPLDAAMDALKTPAPGAIPPQVVKASVTGMDAIKDQLGGLALPGDMKLKVSLDAASLEEVQTALDALRYLELMPSLDLSDLTAELAGPFTAIVTLLPDFSSLTTLPPIMLTAVLDETSVAYVLSQLVTIQEIVEATVEETRAVATREEATSSPVAVTVSYPTSGTPDHPELDVLIEIRDLIRERNRSPAVMLEAADLA